MKITKNITNWLEIHASSPTYGGWVLAGIAICYLGAAINTMAGWLYVISGVCIALVGVSAFLAPRSLKNLIIKRSPIQPVSVGDDITIEIEVHNPTQKPVTLLQVADILPFILGKPVKQPIDTIDAKDSHRWTYYHPTERRGLYRWETVELATGAPWGLFWCRRQRECKARAIVYPTVLPLTSCPLVDEIGQDEHQKNDLRGKPLQLATTGLVRSLRPYRIGDPTRLIHWRTSARYGELRVRELEVITGGQEIIIALDSAANWQQEQFEQAVIAAASLYFYAHRQQLQVELWTAATGLIKGDIPVLETLAATNPLEEANTPPDNYPLIWLTQNPLTLSNLPLGSRWVLWEDINPSSEQLIVNRDYPGIILHSEQELQLQLQKPLSSL
ncbi:DUF58 domain-containing protein [Anabaena cylindrica FACHB-243]|uniref:DUF58 domain-containing protein n=1 Tax=Anabaena cylindrica (strain ATCC 27899 / PCC 7122) TaxID=272123 RepID=K9ZMC7_ANACC|nr:MULTISPECIES: DUF58 domain-containing protein [Anabaena]AFZ59949.1 protein of unknown function DUF58 [Anabaena cylindrica PCC 7122]MBD2419042.1 DUF58 domain-containing protein [Anabaena cylindrica FACHB-243]MBY5282677.1 DUF58 domain-containing protein [Anabaena sp. CCAP 1446/1C]MBY5307553.1 DUF58 domain-containing protein [Anabaena sp. CCAP 1446/1C]MCM2404910.1 DUF58 domain-containing protein [Anabaena sp. CCAP 1446/1C]